jgi:hypothetical protein
MLKMKSFLKDELRDRQDKREGLTHCATRLIYLTHGSWMMAPDIARVKLRKRKLLRDVSEYPGLPPGANLCRLPVGRQAPTALHLFVWAQNLHGAGIRIYV